MSQQTTLSGWLSKAKTLDSKGEPGVEKENLGGGKHGEGGRREKEYWETWKFRFDEQPKGREGELVTATYNIRGGAEGKTINLFNLMKDCAIDILAIQETKCTGRQAYWGWKRMVEERVVTVWADARGASGGVGLVEGEVGSPCLVDRYLQKSNCECYARIPAHKDPSRFRVLASLQLY
jgi:hypothetical protein